MARPCGACDGTGSCTNDHHAFFDMEDRDITETVASECPACGGSAMFPGKCSVCGGSGKQDD